MLIVCIVCLSLLGLFVVLGWFCFGCFDFVRYSGLGLVLLVLGFLWIDLVGVWLFAFWLICWCAVAVAVFVGACLLCYCLWGVVFYCCLR